MKQWPYPLLLFLVGVGLLLSTAFPAAPTARPPLLPQLQIHHHPISTRSHLAQRYFDQALLLAYGFNRGESFRSFQAAATLDPDCALCYWGMAYAGDRASGEDAIQTAIALSKNASEPEKAYIQALATRYKKDEPSLAYADAMRQVVQRYPNDLDAATLLAQALMDTTPWHYWQANGDPTPTGREMIAILESVLQREPDHPGALHFYIHAVEEKRPDLGATVADRLRDRSIAIGHLLHMPSHIYLRLGRYTDAIESNQRAAAVDLEYIQTDGSTSSYATAHLPHIYYFLWYTAMLSGQQTLSLHAAQQTASLVSPKQLRQPGYGLFQHYQSLTLYTQVKFQLWDDILKQAPPDADLVYPTGVWHFTRGMAMTAKGQNQQALQELEQLRTIGQNPALQGVTFWGINNTADLLQIACNVLAGEIAARQGNYIQAIQFLQTAVKQEDQLNYSEPPPWYAPVRQSLATILLDAGQLRDAEQVFQADLATYPGNVWSLAGLAQIKPPRLNKTGATATVDEPR